MQSVLANRSVAAVRVRQDGAGAAVRLGGASGSRAFVLAFVVIAGCGSSGDATSATPGDSTTSVVGGGGGGEGGTGGQGGQAGVGGAGGRAGGGGAGVGGAPAHGRSAGDLVSAGQEARSPGFKMVFTLGQPSQNQEKMSSPKYRVQGGLVGASGSLP